MTMKTEPPPTYAIIKVKEIVFSGAGIDHVIAEISYPRISIKHTIKITRDELVSFIRAREQVSFKKIPWTLGPDGKINPVENRLLDDGAYSLE